MNIYTFKLTKKHIVGAILAVAALVALLILLLPGQEAQETGVSVTIKEPADCAEYLLQLGYETDSATTETRTVQIPKTFDAVYETYNQMQKECGFDLQKYAGKKVELTTFRVTNWPDEEEVLAGSSRWRVFAHRGGAVQGKELRSDERVMHMLANLESTPIEDRELERLLSFVPDSGQKAVRKTSVSMVIRDEKRAAQLEQDGYAARETEIIRLPRFMQDRQMTGAQIGTAFHRMMRMLDLEALKATADMEREIARQMEQMKADGVVTQAEYAAVPARMLVRFFASPLGVRLLRSRRVEREWAFTYRRETAEGEIQLVQGMIDCCF